jgi:hypothetical protein
MKKCKVFGVFPATYEEGSKKGFVLDQHWLNMTWLISIFIWANNTANTLLGQDPFFWATSVEEDKGG